VSSTRLSCYGDRTVLETHHSALIFVSSLRFIYRDATNNIYLNHDMQHGMARKDEDGTMPDSSGRGERSNAEHNAAED
jgi:hypothetical protein